MKYGSVYSSITLGQTTVQIENSITKSNEYLEGIIKEFDFGVAT